MYSIVLLLLGVVAGIVASVTGFGIGSILTPYLALSVGTKLAIACVALPHFLATLQRFLMMRSHVDRSALLSFGLMSAAGGLTGALLHNAFSSHYLTIVFGALLIVSGVMGLTGLARTLHLQGLLAQAIGALSGLFGGMVGNQGGIRTAGLLAFDLSKEAFVATATAVGVIVDVARLPVYLWQQNEAMLAHWPLIAIGIAGTVVGTLIGARFLKYIPEPVFRIVVSSVVLLLGIVMLTSGVAGNL